MVVSVTPGVRVTKEFLPLTFWLGQRISLDQGRSPFDGNNVTSDYYSL